MIIEYEGERFPFDLDDLTVKQAKMIERHLGGQPMMEFEKGLATGSADAYQALGWLILHRGDPDVAISDVDFKFSKLARAFEAAAEAEKAAEKAAEEAEPGPTVAATSNGRKPVPASSPSG